MRRVATGLQQKREDVREVGTSRLLVDRALVQTVGLASLRVNGEDVNHGNHRVQDLRLRFDQLRVATVPPSAVQKQTVHVHTCNTQ